MKPNPSLNHARQNSEEQFGTLLEEIAERLRGGQPIDLANYQRQYPEHAERIAQMLPTLEAMVDLGKPVQQPTSDSAHNDRHRTLGDFRILQEIGRGGMGVVYEAEQISLGRGVALKVLPYAAVMDQKAITRFKNEARAAATLEHPHIVPVHAVGNERGVYYYAMSLIDGLTMAEVIRELQLRATGTVANGSETLSIDEILADRTATSRATADSKASCFDRTLRCESPVDEAVECTEADEPTRTDLQAAIATRRSLFTTEYFRNAARLGREAAEALHHAHQHAIVHRDIKPGNLMIDQDGKLWVTDFGLARVESDPGMTITGDLIGTLRYMSPEQALANRVVVDHRADIYALGVTLYELLALRPTYDGADRQQLLRQIALQEPKSPRHFNRSVPVDLETIVLKAIAKNPDERYSSAQEMADDLAAFLANEPIQAKPPTIMQRTSKWAQRHKPLVTTASIILIMTTVGLAISNTLIAQQRDAAQTAQANEQRERREADHQRDEAQRLREEAERERAEAERQKQVAEENFQRAREAVDTYLTDVSQNELLNAPSLQPLRKELLELALKYYLEFVKERQNDPALRAELWTAYRRAGSINDDLGSMTEAIRLYEEGINIGKQLVEENPDLLSHQNALAKSYGLLSQSKRAIGQTEDGGRLLENAIQQVNRLVQQQPDDRKTLHLLATLYAELGMFHSRTGNRHEAVDLCQKAIKIKEQLVKQAPSDSSMQHGLAIQYRNLALYLENIPDGTGDPLASTELCQKAVSILEPLVQQNPTVMAYRRSLADSYGSLGRRERELGNAKVALEFCLKALKIREQLANQNPSWTAPGS